MNYKYIYIYNWFTYQSSNSSASMKCSWFPSWNKSINLAVWFQFVCLSCAVSVVVCQGHVPDKSFVSPWLPPKPAMLNAHVEEEEQSLLEIRHFLMLWCYSALSPSLAMTDIEARSDNCHVWTTRKISKHSYRTEISYTHCTAPVLAYKTTFALPLCGRRSKANV